MSRGGHGPPQCPDDCAISQLNLASTHSYTRLQENQFIRYCREEQAERNQRYTAPRSAIDRELPRGGGLPARQTASSDVGGRESSSQHQVFQPVVDKLVTVAVHNEVVGAGGLRLVKAIFGTLADTLGRRLSLLT